MSRVHVDYGLLFEQFLTGAMSAEEFQAIYLDRFKKELPVGGGLFNLLDDLFSDVDSFTTDQQLLAEKSGFYLEEVALREKVRRAAIRLSTLKG